MSTNPTYRSSHKSDHLTLLTGRFRQVSSYPGLLSSNRLQLMAGKLSSIKSLHTHTHTQSNIHAHKLLKLALRFTDPEVAIYIIPVIQLGSRHPVAPGSKRVCALPNPEYDSRHTAKQTFLTPASYHYMPLSLLLDIDTWLTTKRQ